MTALATYDVEALRTEFPALSAGAAHFDGPGGSQVPRAVAAVVLETLTTAMANRGSVTAAEQFSEQVVVGARQAAADLLGADPRGIVFGRSMTQLTFDFARALVKTWRPGDEIVVSRLDHDANIRPWILAAQSVGAIVRWAEFDAATGELPPPNVASVLSPRTRLVAVTAASNLIGTRPAVSEIAELAHAVGALVYVDGVHFTAHAPVDVAALGADFYACSPYKFLGPHCGIVAGRPELLAELEPDKLLPSTNQVPERFELGTLPYELLAGTTAAIDFLADLVPATASGTRRDRLTAALSMIDEHEDGLRRTIERGLAELPGITVHSRAQHRTPTLLLTFDDRDATDAYRFLATLNINAPAGSFYALEASRTLGLGDAGGLRIGLAPYSNAADVERLLDGLAQFLR
jgi:cysteine desulfurase family protein (TIGR01976 family)